ncbi:MAG: DUF3995 domain-containing protein [Oceanospirillales bacterium]|nr:DUF3995 domain-containing protein [Oceanospirillales bacterium]
MALALLHLYWALGGEFGVTAALPEANGAPQFKPDLWATLLIAMLLVAFAGLAGLLGLDTGISESHLGLAAYAGLAVGGVLLLRAIGETRYVGFLKRVKGTRFARYDTWLYSPFCLLAGLAFLHLAWGRV